MRTDQIYLLVNRRRRRHYRQRKNLQQGSRRFLVGAGAILSLALVAGLLVLASVFASLTENLPSLDTLPVLFNTENGQLLQPTRLYDRSGQTLLLTLENPGIPRRFLPLDPDLPEHLSPQLVQATLGLYDPGFWRHPGFTLQDLRAPTPFTLAERLVDTLLLGGEPEGAQRSLRMRILAGQVVARYGRTRVLEWHLNSAYFGHLAYGADSAAQLYLGKPASQLNLAEAALLVAAMDAPALNPMDAPNAARDQQRAVLDRLLLAGVINSQEYEEARAAPLDLRPPLPEPESQARAFTRLALEQLSAILGTQRVERGGLRIITTLDTELQEQLSCTARMQLQRVAGREETSAAAAGCTAGRLLPTLPPSSQSLPEGLATSAVMLDVPEGQVLAMIGDSSITGERNTLLAHPSGSLLTPYVALAGFARGMGPASLVWDLPAGLPEELAGRQNPDGTYHGPQRLRMAMANDYLTPLSQLLLQIGPVNVWRLAGTLGLPGLAEAQEPAALLYEGGAVTPLAVANAYNVFANLGSRPGILVGGEGKGIQPLMILAVEDTDTRELVDNRTLPEQAVLSPPLAYLVHHILSDESARWPSMGYPNPLEIGRPAGAHTGRTADDHDFWTVGYTPAYLTAVWMGWPAGMPAASLDVRMPSGIWHAIMQYAERDKPAENWKMPPGIAAMQVCDPSGKLPTADCPSTAAEVFLSGTEPVEVDDLYRVVQINRETGRLATIFTPLELIEERTYLFAPPEAQEWARSAGIELPPVDYDTIQVPLPNPNAKITSPMIFSYVRDQVEIQGSAAGEDFASYRVQIGEGLNPRTWIQLGDEETRPVKDGVLARWNTLGQEGLYAVRLLVLRQDQRIDSAVIQVTVDNTIPEAHLLYPQTGQEITLSEHRTITFQAEAEDNIGVARLEWHLDGKKVGEAFHLPYSFPWQPRAGKHTLLVEVSDLVGNSTRSETVEFTVK